MGATTPVQPTGAPKPASSWSVRRVCAILTVLFAVIFAASWWLTPIEPYATLNLESEYGFCVFSPDGSMLVTSGKSAGLRVWDVEQGLERYGPSQKFCNMVLTQLA
jgi:WD40 repeat protein